MLIKGLKKFKGMLPYFISGPISSFISHFNSSNPYTPFYFKFSGLNVSDFFLFRCDSYETVFVAENNLALLLAIPVKCTHVFHFFDVDGQRCGYFENCNDEFHYSITISEELVGGQPFGGFIHQTVYTSDVLEKYESVINGVTFQHRGYTGYRKSKSQSPVYSFVHGNFGGIYEDRRKVIRSLARQTCSHFYTPQFAIRPENKYELYFLNPTKKRMLVTLKVINSFNSMVNFFECDLNAFSSYYLVLEGLPEEGLCNVTWESKLPVFRCIVFDHFKSTFDVFHS